ncbi:hypothetical protein PFISCL1PPCAC_1768 [Pristionchus fissidentatus]|uniref:Acyltransferase n=1 Tax=Pristionchus fissidentatus TaxID=1538716 RepID=A0AAV5UTD8_9BILA|nr:hypothetical protein PFISCL1PPCAC_1768 [Pristionchus fissidentatus]
MITRGSYFPFDVSTSLLQWTADRAKDLLPTSLYDLCMSLFMSCKRASEVLIVGGFIFLWIISPVVVVWLPVALWFTDLWWTVPLYAAWMYYDWDTAKTGGRPIEICRNNIGWNLFADYFPLKLVKTAELSPERNYIVGSHPHGVLSIGACATFLTDSTGFSKLFPGLTANLLTLNGQFWFPLRRDFGFTIGGAESSRTSLKWTLRNPGKGRAIGIVLGGLNESIMARPGRHDLKLLNRRGFCRFALQFGADLVPLYHFGENELFDQAAGNYEQGLKNMQARIRNLIGFCPPLPMGRSLLNLPWGGILPYRKPVTSVMGKPIRVKRVENPTDLQVDLLHQKYCDALVDLFEKNKKLYDIPDDQHINFY